MWEPPIKSEIFIPTGDHPGAFGVKRKYDIHTGVDLYCENGTDIYAVETSTYVDFGNFTGPSVGMPWWNDTQYIVLKGKYGYVLYGEINLPYRFKPRLYYKAGQFIANIKAVLPPEKKRPDIHHHSNAMLHIELYKEFENWVSWNHNEKQPECLLDPTEYLKSIKGVLL